MDLAIIGGGFCGTRVAKNLEDYREINIILIDKKPYFIYKSGLHRAILNPQYIKKITVSYTSILDSTRIVNEEVINVNSDYIETEKEKIDFDYLVISTGAKYPIPLKNKEDVITFASVDDLKEINRRLRDIDNILIIGGGLVGVELAAELATKVPTKNITVVHSKNRLIERNPEKASKYAEKFLIEHNVEIIFNERIVSHRMVYSRHLMNGS